MKVLTYLNVFFAKETFVTEYVFSWTIAPFCVNNQDLSIIIAKIN